MAIDDYLASLPGDNGCAAVFRLYSWQRPTLSCGFHQVISKRIDIDSCRRHKIDLVRRPTGGRELLHDGDLSFSIIGYDCANSPVRLAGAKDFFFKAGRIICGGLEYLGIRATIVSGTRTRSNAGARPCLAVSSQYEIKAGGKKVVPMAQRLYPGSILVHGSIPLRDSGISTARLLRVKNPENLQRQIDGSSTNLYQLLNNEVDIEGLKKSLFLSFRKTFAGDIGRQTISKAELTGALKESFNWEIN